MVTRMVGSADVEALPVCRAQNAEGSSSDAIGVYMRFIAPLHVVTGPQKGSLRVMREERLWCYLPRRFARSVSSSKEHND